MEQHLHSIHCHLYLRTETIMFAVNCKHVGCPITRTYARHGLRIWGRNEESVVGCEQKGARTFILCRRTVNSKLSFSFHFFSLFFFDKLHLFLDACLGRKSNCTEQKRKSTMFDDLVHKCDSTCLSPFLSTKTSGIMIRPRMFPHRIFYFVISVIFFFLMLYFEHTVIIWNNRW